jgi:hypothetical protein
MRTSLALTLPLALLTLPAQAKDPAEGANTFVTYEAFLSPAQEPGEESEVPKPLEKSLGSQAPATPRASRQSRGWGQVRFARDMSKAFVDVQIAGVKPEDILMFHIHCGPTDSLGPIIVDFGEGASPAKKFKDGKFTMELTNANIKFVKDMPGLKPSLPESCPVEPGMPVQTRTLVGLEHLASKGVLYFNLHTKAHIYYGEMRGQLYKAKE